MFVKGFAALRAFDNVLEAYRKRFRDKIKTLRMLGQSRSELSEIEATRNTTYDRFPVFWQLLAYSDVFRAKTPQPARHAGG
jgi:hypothetical protein